MLRIVFGDLGRNIAVEGATEFWETNANPEN